ncbi:CvpA family protein [Arachidicoccus sp.]|jgi:membrane protein required for colicin V production|uniref:CvpA family protein n=1 Tax=Arachidicoccus sp. TaxID=1872624 RepID=UPI003D23E831
MIIDIIAAIILVLAIFKGYKQGVIMAIFSFLALIIGVAAAMKLSLAVANYMYHHGMHGKWISFLAFIIVLIVVILMVKLSARIIQKIAEVIFMGWLNRLVGIALYTFIYLTIFSVLLFYADKIGLIGSKSMQHSITYKYIGPLGPFVIDNIGKVIPWFKNMFTDLSGFFAGIALKTHH